MIGILIVTHADLGSGLINATELIAGKQPGIKAIGLYHGDGVTEFEETVRASVAELNDGDGVLGLVDFLGGTPANTVLKIMSEKSLPCIAGANMPMLLEIISSRYSTPLEELKEKVYNSGVEGVLKLEDICRDMQEDCADEIDF